MSAVHQVGIVHRDLKPANILLTPAGVPKIADFGIGKVMVEQEIAQTQTRFTTLGAGSLGYVSPEQAEGQPAHPTDDVYSLAVILWQMLSYTLKPPPIYVQDSVEDLEIPEVAKQLILDCLRPRKKRPQDAGELLKRLQLVKGGKTSSPAKASSPPAKASTPPAKASTPPAKASSPSADDRKGQLFTFETVFVDRRGQVIKREPGQARQVAIDLGQGVTLEMVYIPGGTFFMGAAPNEADANSDEQPSHKVTVKPFYLGKYQVTQVQWQAIVGNNPSYFKGENRPVEQVSWEDSKAFCDRLSQRTGQTFRLPSEAEWEYACRAGTTTPFYFGETITPDLVNYNGDNPYGDAPKGKYRQETTPVGSFPPNAFGLYDMHGNVWEWCEDVWHENYEGAPTDGSVWEAKKGGGLLSNLLGGGENRRLLRGGSWYNYAVWCRAAPRHVLTPDSRYYFIGLRVVLCAVWTS
jgi:formylglycine-generating enzyme required for sulfatase activity